MRYHRYVALGDSTAEGLDDPDGAGGYHGWSDRLARRIAAGQGALLYANLAIRGRKTAQVRAEQLDPAVAMRPDLVTVATGVNDVLRVTTDLDEVAADQLALLAGLRAAGATVVTMTYPDPAKVMAVGRLLSARMRRLNDGIRQAADATGALVCDFADEPLAADLSMWSEDRIHASTSGHIRIAAAFAWRLGLPGADRSWASVDTVPVVPRGYARLSAEAGWARNHLVPYVSRHLRGVSMGDGLAPKRPSLQPVT